jgi:nitroreductase
MSNPHDGHHHPVNPDTILQQLEWRYATKHFAHGRKIDAADLAILERIITLAPSSFGLAPWKFMVVSDPAVRAKLRQAAWNQAQVEEASHLVVLAFRKNLSHADVQRYIDRIAAVRNVPVEALKEYKHIMDGFVKARTPEWLDAWSARQTYIALGFLLSGAAMLGIDACPMEGFDPQKFNEILGLDALGYSAAALCALGYRAADDVYAGHAKVRFEAGETIVHV